MGAFGDPRSINGLVGTLNSVQASAAGIHDDLDHQVGRVVPADWDGSAAAAFVGHWGRRQTPFFGLIQACGRMARVLDQLAMQLEQANRLADQAAATAAATGMCIDSEGRTLPSNPVLAARIGEPAVDPTILAHAQALMAQARRIAETAWSEALTDLSALAVPQIDPAVTVAGATRWVDEQVPGAGHRSFWQKLGSDGLQDLGDVVSGGLAMLGGGGLMVAGAGGEVGGVALDATGAGAIVGVPVNVLSAGAMVTGGAITIGGAALAGHGLGGLIAMARGSSSGRTGGKAGSTDIPSWAKGAEPEEGESGKDFARRLMDEKYGPGSYDTGPRSEYNKLKKYGDRHFKPR